MHWPNTFSKQILLKKYESKWFCWFLMFAKDCLLSCNSVYAKLRNIKFKFKVQVELVPICSLFSFLAAAVWFTSNSFRKAAIKQGFARNESKCVHWFSINWKTHFDLFSRVHIYSNRTHFFWLKNKWEWF